MGNLNLELCDKFDYGNVSIEKVWMRGTRKKMGLKWYKRKCWSKQNDKVEATIPGPNHSRFMPFLEEEGRQIDAPRQKRAST